MSYIKPPRRPRYVANSVALSTRWTRTVLALLLLAYGSYGLWVNDVYLPGKRSRGIHLHDESALLCFVAMVCASLVLLSVVLDHYDRRDNEHRYRQFGKVLGVLGWVFLIGALLYGIVRQQTS